MQRLGHQFGVHVVKGNAGLADVVKQVLHQQLQRQHGQKGQKRAGHQHREHVAKVGTRRHADVLEHVRERAAAFHHALVKHQQAFF